MTEICRCEPSPQANAFLDGLRIGELSRISARIMSLFAERGIALDPSADASHERFVSCTRHNDTEFAVVRFVPLSYTTENQVTFVRGRRALPGDQEPHGPCTTRSVCLARGEDEGCSADWMISFDVCEDPASALGAQTDPSRHQTSHVTEDEAIHVIAALLDEYLTFPETP